MVSSAAYKAFMAGANLAMRFPTSRRRTSSTPRAKSYTLPASTFERSRPRYTRKYRASTSVGRKSWQSKARMTVGNARNYSTAKTNVGYTANNQTKFNQSLNVASCIRVSKGTAINNRARDTAVVSGVRIQFAVGNLNAYDCFLNWAVVHPKDEQTITASQADFFRDYGASRAWNANSNAKTGLEWTQAALNTDKLDVLRRGKFMLGGLDSTSGASISPIKPADKEMDIYVKLGRQCTWDGDAAEPFENVYFVFWLAGPLQLPGTASGDGFTEFTKITTYFREPLCG